MQYNGSCCGVAFQFIGSFQGLTDGQSPTFIMSMSDLGRMALMPEPTSSTDRICTPQEGFCPRETCC